MPPVKGPSDKSSPESNSDTPRQRKRPGRVPVSCAECRRLKLRCDRKVPCETCTKRGCAALCPDGALITGGKGTRQAVADVEELKKKIESLQSRSNALENALRTIQAAVTDEPHPLLTHPDAGTIPCENCHPTTEETTVPEIEEEVLDAFGTLTLGPRGETRFFGQTSRSEYLIHAPERLTTNNPQYPRLSKEIVDEANKELDVQCKLAVTGKDMMALLPPLSQACKLCETFLEHGKYLWCPLPRKYIFDDIVGKVYSTWKDKSECNIASTHQLALMWMIYALATLMDLNYAPSSVEAHEYYLLARLSLRYAPPAHDTTLTSIQTMIYMAQYLELSDCEPAHTQSHKAWMQIGHAVKLGHSIGLHMNSQKWKLCDSASTERNRVFWQLFFQDTWLSFGFGRPPSINLAFVDCEIPVHFEDIPVDQDRRELGFHSWVWQFTKFFHTIMTTAFGAKAPTYSKVMELDKRVRDFPVPDSLRIQCGQVELPAPTTALVMQRLFGTLFKETTLMNLHRPYFSQALNGMPHDPLRHRYGPSVMAIYRSAWRIMTSARCAYKAIPGISSRYGMLWSYALAGSIVMCLVVIRAPASNLARSSLSELDKLCELFEEAAGSCQIASNNLEVVRKLHKQAHDAINKAPASAEDANEIHTELDRLGGKTYLICPQNDMRIPCVAGQPTRAVMCAAVLPEMIHPTIMQDMRAFDVHLPGASRAAPAATGEGVGTDALPRESGGEGQGGSEGSEAGAPVVDMSRIGADVVSEVPGEVMLNFDLPSSAFNPAQMDFTFPEFDIPGITPGLTPGSSSSGTGSSPETWMNGVSGSGTEAGQVNGNGNGNAHVNGSNMMDMDPTTNGIMSPSGMGLGTSGGPPVLDATWQAFVEQLGF